MYIHRTIFTLLVCILAGQAGAQVNVYDRDTFPVPPANRLMLFYLQRTPNTNTVIYQLNLGADGKPAASEPVTVHWIRYTEPGNPRKDLNFIQRKFAYGVKSQESRPGEWDIRLVAYDKVKLTLKEKNGKYHLFTLINGQEAVLEKAYIKIDGGTFWSPNVLYIELFGRDANGRRISQRIIPKK